MHREFKHGGRVYYSTMVPTMYIPTAQHNQRTVALVRTAAATLTTTTTIKLVVTKEISS